MVATITEGTLDDALAALSENFFLDTAIIRNDDGTYDVESTTRYLEVGWTRKGGLVWYSEPEPDDHTRLMDPCETFTGSEHLHYHFPGTIAMLEEGGVHRVEFTYQVVYTEEPDPEDDDNIIGWVLAAYCYTDEEV